MWRHSHCPAPRTFFLFRQFDSNNCDIADVKLNFKGLPNVPYLFIKTYFSSYRSGERVMGAFPHPTFSYTSPLFPFVLSSKSFVAPLFSCGSWHQKMGALRIPFEGFWDFLKISTLLQNSWNALGPIWRGFQLRRFHRGLRGSGANPPILQP